MLHLPACLPIKLVKPGKELTPKQYQKLLAFFQRPTEGGDAEIKEAMESVGWLELSVGKGAERRRRSRLGQTVLGVQAGPASDLEGGSSSSSTTSGAGGGCGALGNLIFLTPSCRSTARRFALNKTSDACSSVIAPHLCKLVFAGRWRVCLCLSCCGKEMMLA